MKLEDQVCSLELAKRLKELGVKQESVCFWSKRFQEYGGGWVLSGPILHYKDVSESISAFTVAELGEMLPDRVYSPRVEKTYGCYTENDKGIPTTWEADTEADARAKMLVYIIDQRIMKP